MTSILERLVAHRTIGGVPRAELEWLVARGHLRELAVGDVLTARAGIVAGLFVVLSGRLSIRVDRGAGVRMVMSWQGGDVTGLLPYSRLKAPPADVVADEPSTVFLLDRLRIPAMIQECPELTAVCVHVMIDRARVFKSSELLDEKMLSLGRLAAGLAHELNNPASAVARNAAVLAGAVADLDRATRAFCALGLSDERCARLQALREQAAASGAGVSLSPIERADREDAVAEWLSDRHVSHPDPGLLADAGVTAENLRQMAGIVGDAHMGTALDYLATEATVRRLAADVETAASRIHTLVAAVKRFTYMDQAMVPAPVQLGQGIKDTIMVLGSKARHKSIDVRVELAPELPSVNGFGGELNQIWTNLLDNALDATPEGGRVTVKAAREGATVVVRISDTGHGIPPEVQPRIFDPFFTTKDVGEGTGLGLDIARRLVLQQRGGIDFSTSTAGTEFRVTLPVAESEGGAAVTPASERSPS